MIFVLVLAAESLFSIKVTAKWALVFTQKKSLVVTGVDIDIKRDRNKR